MGASISSHGPTDGGGGASMSLTQCAMRESCRPLTNIMMTRPSANMPQPIFDPNHEAQIQPRAAHKPIEMMVLIMLTMFQSRGAESLSKMQLGRTTGREKGVK